MNGIYEGSILTNDWTSFPIAYGVVVYLFEGIGMIIPIEQKMKYPESFPKVMWFVFFFLEYLNCLCSWVAFLVLNNVPFPLQPPPRTVHLTIATVVCLFGLIGYLAFYQCTQAPILNNLPANGPLVITTVWSLNVALIFTYPIMMYPVFTIIEKAIFGDVRYG